MSKLGCSSRLVVILGIVLLALFLTSFVMGPLGSKLFQYSSAQGTAGQQTPRCASIGTNVPRGRVQDHQYPHLIMDHHYFALRVILLRHQENEDDTGQAAKLCRGGCRRHLQYHRGRRRPQERPHLFSNRHHHIFIRGNQRSAGTGSALGHLGPG